MDGPFHYVREGHPEPLGPFSFEEYAQLWRSKEIEASSYGLWPGASQWQLLSDNHQLVAALEAAAPGTEIKFGVSWQVLLQHC